MSSGIACDSWRLEWTYPAADSVPLLDEDNGEGEAWVDHDERVTTPVAASGTQGKTLVQFPKSRRASVVHCSLEPGSKVTANFRAPVVTDLDALAGTCVVWLPAVDDGVPTHPDAGARVRLKLDLEYH